MSFQKYSNMNDISLQCKIYRFIKWWNIYGGWILNIKLKKIIVNEIRNFEFTLDRVKRWMIKLKIMRAVYHTITFSKTKTKQQNNNSIKQ